MLPQDELDSKYEQAKSPTARKTQRSAATVRGKVSARRKSLSNPRTRRHSTAGNRCSENPGEANRKPEFARMAHLQRLPGNQGRPT
ncbi:hypothetical protein OV208_24815 [Corallococcus sp. bb12-1]|uniref:hypothetical protein n=1 Tax=Corallococcus sp. bb12-1 TaxID=2996784 RepID=UPI002270AB7A|nr:hypothetical protein [Corallococcus sp. bb12-1]MCY1044562.1 hypothetical protein [Corallococcus sp. bb12-1]